MRVVALISGGKDSCYNMMQCVSAGHTIVALANLKPHLHSVSDELDSYMYQTVGHQAVDLYAEALDLPLYRHIIKGSSLNTGRDYSHTDGDEVEDLYHLLKLVKEKEKIEAVSVGAILSDYQRVRVENVCARLQLHPLAYLWHRDQSELLREMISGGLHAILIKVAAFGLDPEKHLGKSLDQMEICLQELSQKYGVHVCGEGGEYESFTIDCPLFKKKIIIDSMETIIHSADAFAPVGYLRFTQMHTEVKHQDPDFKPVSLCKCPCQNTIDRLKEELKSAGEDPDVLEDFPSNTENHCEEETDGGQISVSQKSSAGYQWITGLTDRDADVQTQTQHVFTLLQSEVQARGLVLNDAVLVHLYVSDLQNFSLINSVYCRSFKHNPPARVCVQIPLPVQQFLRMDVLLHDRTTACEEGKGFNQRDVLHVQGLSHWAPANIGPYSQAVRLDEVVLCAGQIALVPCTLQLMNGSVALQTQLSFSHVEKVLKAVDSNLRLSHVIQIHIYVTHRKHIPAVRKVHTIQMDSEETHILSSVAVVSSLPRGAAVELHVIAVQDKPRDRTSCHMTSQIVGGTIECDLLRSSCGRYATASVSLCFTDTASEFTREDNIIHSLVSSVQNALEKMEKNLTALCARVFYQKHVRNIATGFQTHLKNVLERSAPVVALVPVHDLSDRCVLHISCWFSV